MDKHLVDLKCLASKGKTVDILVLCSLSLKKPRDTILKEMKGFELKTELSQSGSLK